MIQDSLELKSGVKAAQNWLFKQNLFSQIASLGLGTYFIGANSDQEVYLRSRKVSNLLLGYGWDIEHKFANGTQDLIRNKKEEGKAPIYISNHHNILIDPLAIMVYIHNMFGVKVHPVIGDNLHYENLIFEMITQIGGMVEMPRNGGDVKKIIRAYSYFFDYLKQGESVWIAQSPGRSKNGILNTDERILASIGRFGVKNLGVNSLGGLLDSYPIIPVSLTYFNSPDEKLVAKQLFDEFNLNGKYVKPSGEDIKHMKIGTNIFNYHLPSQRPKLIVKYGTPITNLDSQKELLDKVDTEIKTGIEVTDYHYQSLNEFRNKYQYMDNHTRQFLATKYEIPFIPNSNKNLVTSLEDKIHSGVLAARINVAGLNKELL